MSFAARSFVNARRHPRLRGCFKSISNLTARDSLQTFLARRDLSFRGFSAGLLCGASAFCLGTYKYSCLEEPVKRIDTPSPVDANGYMRTVVRGVAQPGFMTEPLLQELQDQFQLQDTDIVIATYPKCGTTWMQQIILTLLHDGDKSKVSHVMAQAPWIEGASGLQKKGIKEGMLGKSLTVQELSKWDGSTEFGPASSRRVFKTHATVEMVPWKGGLSGVGGAKIVVVVRNPKDACISLYHHSKNSRGFGYMGHFEHFTSTLFLPGLVESGCFWAWHADWLRAAAGNKSVHVVSFEELKQDPEGCIRQVADFIGIPASTQVIMDTVAGSSFESMKESTEANDKKLLARGIQPKIEHIRQGKMGSWRKDLDGALLQEFDAVHKDKTSKLGLSYKFDFGED